jgi:hypothetical protein
MSLEEEAKKLEKRGLISPTQRKKIKVAGEVNYHTLSNAADAQKFLDAHRAGGGQGFVTPVGPNGIYGHEVRYWKD